MFVLKSDITIGKYVSVKPNAVSIRKSMFEYVSKAIIKLPSIAVLKADGALSASEKVIVDTAKQIAEGDKVTIRLAYNDDFNTEFEGFVSRINFTTPVEVECDGYSWLLKKKTYQKTFVKTELKTILQYLTEGTGITLDTNIPSFIIEKIVLQKNSGTEALEMLKKISEGVITIFFEGNVLHAGVPYLQTEDTSLKFLQPVHSAKYKLGWNVIKDGNLKQRVAANDDVTVNIIGEKKDGSTVKVIGKNGKTNTKARVVVSEGTAGSSGETKVIKTQSVTDKNSLNLIAAGRQSLFSYDGYEGKITGFLQPYCSINWMAELEDTKYPERSGQYLILATETTYGMQGARRSVQIGQKIYA